MDLIKPWLAALAAFLAASLGMAYVTANATTPQQLETISGTTFWNVLPSALTFLLVALFAAVSHAAPHRHDPRRHRLAVCGIPTVAILYCVVYGLLTDAALATVTSIFGCLIGTIGGWTVASRLRRHKSPDTAAGGISGE